MKFLDFLLKILTLFSKIPQKTVFVQCLTGMEISEFPNISFEHPFRKIRAQILAPVQFTNPNSNHRDSTLCEPRANLVKDATN